MTGSIPHAGTRMNFSPQMVAAQDRGSAAAGQAGGIGVMPPGLVAGTRVLTADGACPVELLGPGDRIITRNAGIARLIDLRFRQYRGDFVQIAAGALGASRPDTDTVIAAGQTVLLRGDRAMALTGQDTALMRVADLPAFADSAFLRGIEMTVVQLIFERAQLVYADGLETLCVPADQKSLAA